MKLIKNISLLLFSVLLFSCEKEIKFKYDYAPIRQVLICNISPNVKFEVSLSISKYPEDYSPVIFIQNATVNLYEDGVLVETLPYIYKDSSTGYGFYTSTYLAIPGKTYTITTSDAAGLPGVSATEYLPLNISLSSFSLEQFPDADHPNKKGILSFDLDDNFLLKDYYYASVFYRVLKPKIRNGDTTWVEDFIYDKSPISSTSYPNPSNSSLLYFTDTLFNGNNIHLQFEFPGYLNSTFKEIDFIFGISHLGKNYYDYYGGSVSKNTQNINAGFGEPVPEISNIENGYGHFSAQNGTYTAIRLQ